MSDGVRKLAVIDSLKSLGVNITQLRERIQVLSERLNPIMAPPSKPSEKDGEIRVGACKMCNTLNFFADQVLKIDEVVRELVDRLEI